jgi:hypothetical protein
VAGFEGSKKFKLVAVAMVTKVQKRLNSLQTSQSFAVMFPVTSTSRGTIVCGSFWRVDKIQNDVTMETEVTK